MVYDDDDSSDEEDGESYADSRTKLKSGRLGAHYYYPSSSVDVVSVSTSQTPAAACSSNIITSNDHINNNSQNIHVKKNRSDFAYTHEQLINMNSRSPEWMKIPKSEKEKLGLVFEDDGEFW